MNINRWSILLVLSLVIFILPGCQPAAPPENTPTPTAAEEVTPVIDGTLSAGEWDEARVEHFADGSELFLMQRGETAYIGIRSNTPDMIMVNVFIAQGDEIDILHASAALGTAAYQKEGDDWLRTREFTWSCRDTSESPAALAERDAFLQAEGWVSTNSYVGSLNEVEYQVEIREEPLRLVVAFLRVPGGDQPTAWPTSLEDDSTRPLDDLQESMDFSIEQWGVLGTEE